MPSVDVYKMDGTKSGTIDLCEEIFASSVNKPVIHQVIVALQNNKRQGTQSTLTRAEVRGGGIKPWRQKGTGRARQGSIRSPQWMGGGVVFAPKPRCYRQSVNKKMRRLALTGALTSKVIDNNLLVLDNLELGEAKTKEMVKVLKALQVCKRTLIVLEPDSSKAVIAAKNIPFAKTIRADLLNVYDVVNCDKLIATKKAIEMIEEVYAL